MPDLRLHCSSTVCGGTRIFESSSSPQVTGSRQSMFLHYTCRNCGKTHKTFALIAQVAGPGDGGGNYHASVRKIGEHPAFGPTIPARVVTMIGPDRELFLKGRRAESQGLGVGAFAYYRRVVEQQWQRIVAEIVRVAQTVGASEDVIDTLNRAREETQFSRAVEMIKDAVPESLRISGHNPITLVYAALSDGLHAQSDEECLRLATSVRVVLTELADRIVQALKDENRAAAGSEHPAEPLQITL